MNENKTENQEVCPVCHQTVLPEYYFCPNCGNNLKEAVRPISLAVKIGMYALAIFLPPLGLWPGAKYLMKKNKDAKLVGAITIILTLVSSVLMAWAIFYIFEGYMEQVNTLLYGM